MDIITEFKKITALGYSKGWHELNGGNLSYRLTEQEVKDLKHLFNDNQEFIQMDITAKNLAGEYFIVTGSGKFLKNIQDNFEKNSGIIVLDETGSKYKVVYGLEDAKPTSELPSHLLNHSVKYDKTNGQHRTIYHAHTTNTLALTFVLPLEDKAFSKALWQMATEDAVVFPEGVGVVEWMVPGGKEIANATSKLMETYNVAIWAHHGCFVSGASLDQAFGLMETVEKAASVYVKVASMGGSKQTITDEMLQQLQAPFNIKLNEKFID
ncbi:MAG: rhamnulose-1-phosphate aldolase [Mycoplasmatales bacterium]